MKDTNFALTHKQVDFVFQPLHFVCTIYSFREKCIVYITLMMRIQR